MKPTQYLQRMGIDVWISRSASQSPQSQSPQSEAPVEAPFYFLLFNYQSVGICCSIGPEEATAPSDIRRFCDDIAFAISHRRELPTVNELRWPQTEGESTQDVVRVNTQGLPETVIVFGEKFANYLFDVEDVSGGSVYRVGEQRIFLGDDVSDYRGSPGAKKSLWINLNKAELIDGNSRT
mgnify:CR=1 FL=1